MLNAAQEQFGGSNPFAALAENNTNSINSQQGRENNEPLPNPWTGGGGSTAAGATTTNSTSQGSADSGTGGTTGTGPGSGANLASLFGGAGGMGGGPDFSSSPGMQSYMQQMMSNPELMQQMMSSPMVQNMMQQMSSNPAMMQQMIDNNPILRNNPTAREQLTSQVFTSEGKKT